MFKRFLSITLLCFVILFSSCASTLDSPLSEADEPVYTMSQDQYFVYKDIFYYIDRGILHYCALSDLKEIETYSKCMCFDPLCEHNNSACMAFTGGYYGMCLRKHNDTIYLYLAYKNLLTETTEIARYDINNAKKTVLIEGLENSVNRFFVTDNLIVFEENRPPYTVIKTYSLTDEECHELPNEEEVTYNLIGYDNGLIYYNDISNNVYSNSAAFDKEEKVFTGILPYGYIVHKGELFFSQNMKSKKIEGIEQVFFNSIDVYKTPLNSPSKENSTMVAKDVCSYGKVSHYIFNDTFYYLPSEPSYIGEAKEVYDDMPEMVHTIINEHNGTICSIDLQTLRKSSLAKELGYNAYTLIYASPEYVILFTNASGYRTDIVFDSHNAVMVYEPQTGELYQILYYG